MYRLLLLLLVAGVGCTPRLAPLYTDFAVSDSIATQERAARALAAAGWTLAGAPADEVIATEPRLMSDWGLYRVYLSVEVLPLRDSHVRVLFHPYRRYLTGGRGKILYLPSGVRAKALPPLVKAFEAQGFEDVLSGEKADRAARDGTHTP